MALSEKMKKDLADLWSGRTMDALAFSAYSAGWYDALVEGAKTTPEENWPKTKLAQGRPAPAAPTVERKAEPLEHVEKVSTEAAMSQWERSLKRPDLCEKDRVRGAIEAYKRQAFAFAISPTPPAAAVRVPEGWQLVPKEPTQEMLDAVTAADQQEPFSDKTMRGVFVEMLSASPSPVDSRDGLEAVTYADAKPFMYGLMQEDGTPLFEEYCVDGEADNLQSVIDDFPGAKVVALYLHPYTVEHIKGAISLLKGQMDNRPELVDWKATTELTLELTKRAVDMLSAQTETLKKLEPLADGMMKIAEQVGEKDDPFAAWEVVDLFKSGHEKTKTMAGDLLDCGMLIKKLIRHLPIKEKELIDKANEFLKRKRIEGSPLRDEGGK